MIAKASSLALVFGCCFASIAPLATAQTSTQLFSPIPVRQSLTSAGYGPPIDTRAPAIFTTLTVDLVCPAQNVTAVLSGPSAPGQSGGNLLADNNILVTVTPLGGASNPPVNVCSGGMASGAAYGLYNQNCFTSSYQDQASSLVGVNPDSLAANDGVPPLDISSLLVPGREQMVKIALTDEGGYLATSTVYLNTSCTEKGVTGPTHVNGSPIPPNDPKAPQLTQHFLFDANPGTQVNFTYDLARAANDPNGTLSITPGATPWVNNLPLTPAMFNSTYRPYTSFATSQCLVHYGEVDSQGNAACKLFMLECVIGTNPDAQGANCPVSSLANEGFTDAFDGPNFYLQSIQTPADGTFREGFGFLMASDEWTGGICTFDPAANLYEVCPQNLTVSFVGPGITYSIGISTHPNSTFISVGQVPEPRTGVRFGNTEVDDGMVWINSTTVQAKFHAVPPYLYDLRGTMAGADTYIASPIKNISYGISAVGQVPNPASEPISTDTVLANGSCPIPTPTNPGDPSVRQPAFDPSPATLTFPGDGLYALHYYAQNCAGTQELVFNKVRGSWTTNFRTLQIGVDTVAPTISIVGPSPAQSSYAVGTVVKLNYSCADAAPGSGVVQCGNSSYPLGTFNTGTVSSTLSTSSSGTHTTTIYARDGAGNRASQSFTYTVQ